MKAQQTLQIGATAAQNGQLLLSVEETNQAAIKVVISMKSLKAGNLPRYKSC
jgi:riboflavin synthase alpha subunit